MKCRIGSEDIARLLLDAPEPANIESVVDQGISCLHTAARHGFPNLVGMFLERGLKVDRKTDLGWTAFHFAADKNEMGVALKLLEFAPDMQAMTNSGLSPLHLAAISGSEDMGSLLLDMGVNIEALEAELFTPLHYAARNGKPKMLAMLLAHGADLMSRTCYEYTPLHFTAFPETDDEERRTGKLECARLLIDAGADIEGSEQNGETILHKAATQGAIELIKLLLRRGANVNSQANNTYIPLHEAIIASKKGAVALLLEGGANVHSGNERAMDLAATHSGDMSIVRLLVKYGASLIGHEELVPYLDIGDIGDVGNNMPGASEPSREDQVAIDRVCRNRKPVCIWAVLITSSYLLKTRRV